MPRNFYIKILILLLSICFISCSKNKYSKEANTDTDTLHFLDKPFRMQKLNVLWQKATEKLDHEQLERLLDDLKRQDKEELELKQIKANNEDPDGMREEEVRRSLRMILKKYKLEPVNQSGQNDQPMIDDTFFKDKKLDNLWKKVHSLDLSEDQLTILKDELREFESQLKDYHQLVDRHNAREHKKNMNLDQMENHIDPSMVDSSNNNEMNSKIQEKHLELKKEYKRINDMVQTKSIKSKDGEFEEEKAIRLWQMALKSDFTPKELESLKEKLLHFENRIKKLNYFTGQLKQHEMKKSKENELEPNINIEDDGNEEKSEKNRQHLEHIHNRIQELDWHVKKLHQQLEEKILNRHVEL